MKTKLPDNETILYALGISQTLGMGYAAYVYEATHDPIQTAFAVSRGLIGGFAISFTLAIGAQKVSGVMTERRRKLTFASGALLLLAVPALMAPAVYLTMSASVGPDWLRVFVSICLAAAPDLAAVVIAALSGSLQAAEKPQSETVAKEKPAKVAPIEVTAPLPVVPVVACKYGCGRSGSQNSLNPHYGKCKNNPANMPVRVDLGV